ncbi:MAG: polyketide cyclase, partial [Pseudomonadota bacterium]
MLETTAKIEIAIAAPRELSFAHIVPIDLTSIITGYGPLPAVVKVQNQTGAWDGAGQSRTVVLSDGSLAQEILLAYT